MFFISPKNQTACNCANFYGIHVFCDLSIYINLRSRDRSRLFVRVGVWVYQILASFSSLWAAVALCT